MVGLLNFPRSCLRPYYFIPVLSLIFSFNCNGNELLNVSFPSIQP